MSDAIKAPNLRKRLKELKALEPTEAMQDLRKLLPLATAAEDFAKIGRAVNASPLDLAWGHLLGQCTLDYLAPVLAARTLTLEAPFKVEAGPYDQVLQSLAGLSGTFVVLIPWRERPTHWEQELDYWASSWTQARQAGLKILQVGFDWVSFDAQGHSSNPAQLVELLNSNLRRELPTGAFFLDLPAVSGQVGRRHFYDRRSYFWTKQPFSQLGLLHLSDHILAGIRALTTGPKKVLVVDLDNTLWGGEVGEVGWQHIGLSGPEGEAFLAFQQFLKDLSARGILLAVASKNEESVAREAFEKNSNLLLKWTDFVGHQVHWEPKSQSLVTLSESLGLGLESFVFFDDNPRERAEIAQVLPQVSVVDVSNDPCDYLDNLSRCLLFETAEITLEDRQRTESYRQEARRQEARQTVEQYLDHLEMTAEIATVGEATFQRSLQLLAKTNQFNLTTKRHGLAQLEDFLRTSGSYVKVLKLEDRFGDLGLISLLIAIPRDRALEIDTWLMSCRALQRTVEYYFFNDLVRFAAESGCTQIRGRYLPTAKNKPVSKLLEHCGFSPCEVHGWSLEVADFKPLETYVQAKVSP